MTFFRLLSSVRLCAGTAIFVAAAGLCAPTPAWAACANPTGAKGDVIWMTELFAPAYCNNTDWVPFPRGGYDWALTEQVRQIFAPSPAAGDGFGWKVDVDGDIVVSAAAGRDVSGNSNAGAAFTHNVKTGALIATINNPQPDVNDYFGRDVAIQGNKVVVGAYEDEDNGPNDSGTVYVFNATTGSLDLTIANPTAQAEDRFGYSVAIDGNYIVVGAIQDYNGGADPVGAAFVFNATTGALVSTMHNPNPEAGDEFGNDVAIDGDIVVVGAQNDNPGGAVSGGRAYVFNATTGALLHSLVPPTPKSPGNYGAGVAVSNNLIAVGELRSDISASGAGAAHIYDATSGSLLRSIGLSSAANGTHSGNSLALAGKTLVLDGADAPGNGFLRAGRISIVDAETGTELATFNNPNPTENNEYYSLGVGISGNYVVVGAFGDNPSALDDAGSVYIYERKSAPGAAGVQSVGVGRDFGCAVTAGKLFCWGNNAEGRTGLNTTTGNTLIPTQVGVATDWVETTGGFRAACGIRSPGTLWCWGFNGYGQTGQGTTTGNTLVPTQVGSATDWTDIETGARGICGIRAPGTLWCWGDNFEANTGLGATTGINTAPVQVGTDTDWQQVSNGSVHSCAVKTGGQLYCWGFKEDGRVGQGTPSGNQTTPLQVGVATDWASVATGYNHSCGTRTTGRLYCWGTNTYGATGLGTTSSFQSTPTQVSGSYTDWQVASLSYTSTCGIRGAAGSGTLWCWGDNSNYQTGLGTSAGTQTTPAQVGSSSAWSALSAGLDGASGCAGRLGYLYCWGNNANARTGLNTTTGQTQTPAQTSLAPSSCASPAGIAGDIVFNNTNDVLQYCDGIVWHAAGPYGDGGGGCSGPSGAAGALVYNSTHNVLQYCEGDEWKVIGSWPDPCAGSPAPGTVCRNGTVYAGLSPDGNVPMFTTPADAGEMPLNNGNTTGYVNLNITDLNTGEANTLTYAQTDSDSATGGFQPHQAALYCHCLGKSTTGDCAGDPTSGANGYGKSDWYLPAIAELSVVCANKTAIGGFNLSGTYGPGVYRSSFDDGPADTWVLDFSDCSDGGTNGKAFPLNVRCVRK